MTAAVVGQRRPSAVVRDLLQAVAGGADGYVHVSGRSLRGIDGGTRWETACSVIVEGPPLPESFSERLAEGDVALQLGAAVRRDHSAKSPLLRLGVLPITWTSRASYDRRAKVEYPEALIATARERIAACPVKPTMVILGASVGEMFTITAVFGLATSIPLATPADEAAALDRVRRLGEHLGNPLDPAIALADLAIPIPASLMRIDRGQWRAHVLDDNPSARFSIEALDAALAPPISTTKTRTKNEAHHVTR
jgi:hypothetical protein